MKYSESNKPIVCMMTQSTCYKGTRKMTPVGVLWHSTGANNSNLKRYVQPDDNAANRAELVQLIGLNSSKNDWNHISIEAGLNAWIGKLADGTVASVQTMPWDYRPWGCGSGKKGSCNNGWMQFEICEDSLTNKAYFEAVYKEACELTAYYCKMYKLDPLGTVNYNGLQVPVILDHQSACKLGLGSNHADVMHWFGRYGKDLDDVRKDVAALMKQNITSAPAPTQTEEMYRVRKSWKDASSQIGAFRSLDNAKDACKKAGQEYAVFNSKGEKLYPITQQSTQSAPTPQKPSLSRGSKGDEVKKLQTKLKELGFDCGIIDGDFGSKTQNAVINFQAERGLTKDGVCGPKTWAEIDAFAPYNVITTASVLNVRSGPGTGYSIKSQLRRGSNRTIVYKKGNWGKIKNGFGWISLDYATKI